jgi:cysteine desulfurase
MAYLDHNAASPLRPEAKDAVAAALALCGNASSVHGAGRASRALIEAARAQVAGLAGARARDVIFTGSGSEANALALWGAAEAAQVTRLVVFAAEHDSVLANAAHVAASLKLTLDVVPATSDGVADLAVLHARLAAGGGRALVALMAANNETGVIQPMAEALALVRKFDALLFCDAVQAAGKIALPEADYLSLAGHKVGGPQGVGALIARDDAPLAALIRGGGQEQSRRAGSENLCGIAGFGAAAAAASRDMSAGRVAATLRDRFEAGLKDIVPDAVIFGARSLRLANTSNFALPGILAETALMALDLDGVMLSSGAACSSGKVKPSHVLRAMNVGEDLARAALRVSFGWNSLDADVDVALASLAKFIARKRACAA